MTVILRLLSRPFHHGHRQRWRTYKLGLTKPRIW